MFSRIGYVLRETGASLRRNLTLTAAALLTVAISLVLVGGSFLVQRAVDNSLVRWRDGVEFIVFMNPNAQQDQIDSVDRDLRDNPQVRSDKLRFFNKQQAYEEFKRLFPDTPEIIQAVTPDNMPTSFRVVPKTTDTNIIDSIGRQFQGKPGVQEVIYAKKAVDWIRTISGLLYWGFLVAALVLLLGAVMLIWNTIRTAMFARRREIEVMKLVGATNWFIRLPFMLEGLLQGLAGAVLGSALLLLGNADWTAGVRKFPSNAGLGGFVVTGGYPIRVVFLMVLLGAFVGAVG